jgi:ferritin-like metal-binding protein YciE
MKIDTLEKLYEDHTAALHAGLSLIDQLLPKLLRVAGHTELRNMIARLNASVVEQIDRVAEYLPDSKVAVQGHESPGMKGLIDEGHAFLERASEIPVIDAGLIAFLQKVLHYGIAVYGTVGAYASLLDLDEAAGEFHRLLEKAKELDQELSRLAIELINVDALKADRSR